MGRKRHQVTRNIRSQEELAGKVSSKTRKAHINSRMWVASGCLLVAMAATLVQVALLQFVEGEDLKAWALRNYVRTVPIDARRGDVHDRQGGLLAVSVNRWAVSANPQQVGDPQWTSTILADLLGQDRERLNKRLSQSTHAQEKERKESRDPNLRVAREAIWPVARLVADVFQFPTSRFERPFELLEYFHRMDMLDLPGLQQVVQTMSRAAHAAADAINADADAIRFFPSRGRRFVYLARDVDDETVRRLERRREIHRENCARKRRLNVPCTNPLRGVLARPEPHRYYPKRDLASQIVGLVGSDSKALGGIERAMDGVLAGSQHHVSIVRDRRGRSMYLEGVPTDVPLAAHSVELTIDSTVQAKAEEELSQACEVTGARAGYVIVQQVKTGEVIAAASYPHMNPNDFRRFYRERQPLADERLALKQARKNLRLGVAWDLGKRAYPGTWDEVVQQSLRSHSQQYSDFVEYAHTQPNGSRHYGLQEHYEPGSIMKVFTLAGWIENKVRPLDHVYDLERGNFDLEDADDNAIHDDKKLESGDVALILQKSSNIGTAKMAFDMGREQLDTLLRDFGFGATTGLGFPGEARGILRPAAEWTKVEHANIAFGQGVATTGIQLTSALSALGNEGKLMRPLLVRRVLGSDGGVIKKWEPQVIRQVISPETARQTLDLMRLVVEPGGTGTRAYIPEYPVAGKTGTGQKPHLRKRGYADNMWVGTFFGVAPADDPEIAVLVLIDEPKGKRYGGVVAAPAFRRIMRWTLRYMGVPSPYDTAQQLAWLDPDYLEERRAMEAEAMDDLQQVAPPVDEMAAGDVAVPDFRGLTMDLARNMAGEEGLKLRLVGSGRARHQDHQVHTRVPSGTMVTVVFEPQAPHLTANVPQAVGGPAPLPPTPSVDEKGVAP